MKQDRFDLVINILTGLHDYDEASDSGLIRRLCIESGIPIFTDADVAELAILDILKTHETGVHAYRLSDPTEPWNLKKEFLQIISDNGGFSCYHAHFDKAYLITLENLKLGQVDMQKKWKLYRYLKENYSREDLLERMNRAVEMMISQGVTACRTFVDADQTVGLLPMQVALEVRKKYESDIHLEFAVQPLEGVLDKSAWNVYSEACELADVIGGLPSRDRPEPEKHLDYVLGLAREMDKPVDAHVDQENNPDENETELLAKKAIEYGLEGRVRAVHAISVAAKSESDQERTLELAKDAGMSFIVCPSAAISMKQLDKKAPLHNSIVPVPRLVNKGIPVYLGVDNIYDLFMPFVDGDMWFESRLLMEACRFYDIGTVAKMASDKRGFQYFKVKNNHKDKKTENTIA